MREMKDSGIEWIGNIPATWERCKIKNVISSIGSGTTPTSSNIDYYNSEDICWIQSGDLYKTSYISNTAVSLSAKALHLSALQIYAAPFIVVAMYGASVGNIAISTIDACSNQACCCIKPDTNNDLKFMYYWLSMCKIDFLSQSIGGGQPNISQSKIKNQFYYRPQLSEQKVIANFLDSKCSEIDAISADIQKEIETLEQYKRSVITEAVTKGLNPDAEMKDSGIEWVGNIPAHWDVHPLYYYFSERKRKNYLGEEQMYRSIMNSVWRIYKVRAVSFSPDSARFFILYKLHLVKKPTDLHIIWPMTVEEGSTAYHNADNLYIAHNGEGHISLQLMPYSAQSTQKEMGGYFQVQSNGFQQMVAFKWHNGQRNCSNHLMVWKMLVDLNLVCILDARLIREVRLISIKTVP